MADMQVESAATQEAANETATSSLSLSLDPIKIRQMITACEQGQLHVIQSLLQENAQFVSQQDDSTGQSPLMAAAHVGNGALCQNLLEQGAPWNAIDRQGKCAGDYATNAQQWGVVNLLVDWAVRAELVLGRLERNLRQQEQQQQQQQQQLPNNANGPVGHEPSTKPDYLRQRLVYTDDGRALLDQDKDAVMMEWERPLMNAHAQILMEQQPGVPKSVLNIGFGMGIIDTILQQEHQPCKHYIVEAHPDVYRRMKEQGWDQKPNVVILFGPWQQALQQLMQQEPTVKFDAIFFDTYGEHFLDMEEFHSHVVPRLLQQPHGIYSFFNGLAPDNLFFHGVACQCVKLQLSQCGLDSDFLPCEIQVPATEEWQGIRRQYWHGRDTYYLPKCTWNPEFLQTGRLAPNPLLSEPKTQAHTRSTEQESSSSSAMDSMSTSTDVNSKRQRA